MSWWYIAWLRDQCSSFTQHVWPTDPSSPATHCPACRLLEQMQGDLQAGKFVYRAPWAHEPSKTGHSGASSLGAAFLTPGVFDERRSTATPTLVSALCGGSRQHPDQGLRA